MNTDVDQLQREWSLLRPHGTFVTQLFTVGHLLLLFIYFCSQFFLYPCHAVVHCGALVPPANGAVTPSSCRSRSSYGQICTFSCRKQGFLLEGTFRRMCGKEGDWTGVNDTFCRGDDQPRFSSSSFSSYFSSSWSFPNAAAAGSNVSILKSTNRWFSQWRHQIAK